MRSLASTRFALEFNNLRTCTVGTEASVTELGFALPQTGRHATPEAIARFARETERMGYASLWVFERLLRPLDPHPDAPLPGGLMPTHYASVYDPFETLAFAAAHTGHVRLGTSCIVALWHSPAALARRFATLDRLSGGRVIAGIGQGGSGHELIAAGASRRRRGAGFEEFVVAVRACWAPDPVFFDGRFYVIPRSEVGPKPLQPGGPPLIIAGNAPVAIERAARVADGFNPGGGTWESVETKVRLFRETARQAGRDPDRLRVVLRGNRPIASEPLLEPRAVLHGSAEQVAADLVRLDGLGVSDALIDMQSADVPVDDQLELMARLRDHIA